MMTGLSVATWLNSLAYISILEFVTEVVYRFCATYIKEFMRLSNLTAWKVLKQQQQTSNNVNEFWEWGKTPKKSL